MAAVIVDMKGILIESGNSGDEDGDRRMERTGTRSTPNNNQADDEELSLMMNLDLFKAAANEGNVDVFIKVLDKVAKKKGLTLTAIFDQVSPIGNTYLHIAASFGNAEIVGFIAHRFPALITKVDFNGDTPLHLAARAGHWKTVEKLLEFQQDMCHSSMEPFLLRMENVKGNTALHEALLNSRDDVAYRLIQKDPGGAFCLNNFRESPLSLSAKAGYEKCVSLILSKPEEVEKIIDQVKVGKAGKSPVHEAINSQEEDILKVVLSKEARFLYFTDEEGRFPLHYVAYKGYMEGVTYLLEKFPEYALQKDKNGLLPVHWASVKGKIDVIKKLLLHCPDKKQLLDKKGRNILHFMAGSGKFKALSCLWDNDLLNMKDREGNTPLHLAAMNFQVRAVNRLIWNVKVDQTLLNDEGMTALDIVEELLGDTPTWEQMLTWASLSAANIPRVHRPKMINNMNTITTTSKDKNKEKKYLEMVNTLLLVSTLVATVTFAAGFTMPGGYNSSDDQNHQPGMATLVQQWNFQVFVLCDTIAMYCSIISAIFLVWAQLGYLFMVRIALILALPLIGIALGVMSLGFMAGVTVVVGQLKWLNTTILAMGLTFSSIVSATFFPLWLPRIFSRAFGFIFYNPALLSIQFQDKRRTAEDRAKKLDYGRYEEFGDI